MFTAKQHKGTHKTSSALFASAGNSFIQPKLNIGKPNDKYEKEADQVADKVVNKTNAYNESPFFSPIANIQKKCNNCAKDDTLQSKEQVRLRATNHSNDIFRKKDKKKMFFAPRYSNAFQTICDVDVHPDDRIKFALGKDIRHVGTGLPKIKTLPIAKGLKTTNPCLYEISMAHEKVHVNNAKVNCKSFKKCLDKEVEKNWVFDTVSVAEYNSCKKANHGGLAKSCVADEKQAYQKSVAEGSRLANDIKCTAEKSNLLANIKLWKKYAKKPPNC